MYKRVWGFFDIPSIFPFTLLSVYEDPQIFNSPTSRQIFSATNWNIEKASHIFVVYHLLIDIVQFVWS